MKPARQYRHRLATTAVSDATKERRSSVRLNMGSPLRWSAAILAALSRNGDLRAGRPRSSLPLFHEREGLRAGLP